MRSIRRMWLGALCAAATLAGTAFAEQSLSSSLGLSAYPSKGQSASKQKSDEQACLEWAQNQTGINPFAQGEATAEAAPESKHRVAKGAAKGALIGTGVGAIAGGAGKGAAIGAGAGALAGGARKRGEKEGAEQQASAQSQAEQQKFQKSFAACLKGRGYTVE